MDDPTSEEAPVFVVGPIGDRHAKPDEKTRKAYEDALQILLKVIKPACFQQGLGVLRADDIHDMGEVPEQVSRLLRDSPIVVVDLSGLNANVMYELGARHTTGKLTIPLMARTEEPPSGLPFDVNAIRTIIFPRTPSGFDEARERLSKALAAGRAGRGSPVTLTRVWLENPETRLQHAMLASTENRTEISEQPLEVLIHDATTNVQAIHQGMDAGVAVLHEMTAIFSAVRTQAEQTKAEGRKIDALAMLRAVADQLQDPTDRLDVLSVDLAQTIERARQNVAFLVKRLDATPGGPSSYPAYAGMIGSLRRLAESGRSAAEQTEGFAQVASTFASAAFVGPAFGRLQSTVGRLTQSLRRLGELDAILG